MVVRLVGSITKTPKAVKAIADWVKKKFSKKSDTITSVTPAKDLKKRREDFEDITKAVDDSRKRFRVPKTTASDKIKYDAVKKISKIRDKGNK